MSQPLPTSPFRFQRYGRHGSRTYIVHAPWDELGTVSAAADGWWAHAPDAGLSGPHRTRLDAAVALLDPSNSAAA